MGKLIIVDRKKLKISAEEHEKKMKEDPITARMLKEQERLMKETLKKLKEDQ